MLQHYKGKHIIITGASSGIGAALVRHLAAVSCELFIGARSLDKLISLQKELSDKPARITPFVMDLSSDDSLVEAVEELQRQTKHIDILINNAGISPVSYTHQTMPTILRVHIMSARGVTHTHNEATRAYD